MVTAYRTGAIEAWIMLRLINVPSVILANLVVGDNVVPEFLQTDCTAEKLSRALRDVLEDLPLRRRQVEAFAKIDALMSTGDATPSMRGGYRAGDDAEGAGGVPAQRRPCAVPTSIISGVEMVGTLRFAHPTGLRVRAAFGETEIGRPLEIAAMTRRRRHVGSHGFQLELPGPDVPVSL